MKKTSLDEGAESDCEAIYCLQGDNLAKAEKIKASVRAKVEHAFHYIKRVFGYSKVRYRGLAKNTNRLQVLAALANLLRARPYLTP